MKGVKEDKWFNDIIVRLNEITSPYWEKFEETTLIFDPLYRVALGPLGDSAIPVLFGKSRLGRLKNHLKNLRRPKKFSFKARVPKDSVVFIQPGRKRFIIVSPEKNIVLKISVSPEQLSLLSSEVELMRFISDSTFKDFAVKILDNGPDWLITTVAPNRDALLNEKSPERYLLKNINTLAMNPLCRFYQSRGIELITLGKWLERAKFRAKGHPEEALIEKVLQKIQTIVGRNSDLLLPNVQLHFDLHSRNILFDEGKITFIDWEVTTLGLWAVDYFDIYRRLLKKDRKELKAFLHFLKGGEDRTKHYRVFTQNHLQWIEGLNISNSFKLHKLHPYLYSAERTLIYFDKWKENRLADRKGLEFLIANTCQEIGEWSVHP